jgi:hypothetical protein
LEKGSTDDGGYIPARFSEFVEIFTKKNAETVAPHRRIDHPIHIKPDYQLPYGRMYNLSDVDLRTLQAYFETNLPNGFLQRSSSAVAVPLLFAKKKGGGLNHCVDYRELNKTTVKNRCQLPLVLEMVDQHCGAHTFTDLDRLNPYHLIQFKKADEYQPAFRKRYGQFKYRVMPFGLTHRPATFQCYIGNCLPPHIDNFAVCYLGDILIYSED